MALGKHALAAFCSFPSAEACNCKQLLCSCGYAASVFTLCRLCCVSAATLGCAANLYFVVPNTTASGLTVREVKLMGEAYKFYKGVRTFLRAGSFVVRY